MLKYALRDMVLALGLIGVLGGGGVLGIIVLTNMGMSVPVWVLIVGVMLTIAGPIILVVAVIPNLILGWVNQVRENGAQASAEVLANVLMKGVGGYEGADRLVDLPVRVMPAGESPFEARMRCKLSDALFFKAGSQAQVRYDPNDRRRVVLAGNPLGINIPGS